MTPPAADRAGFMREATRLAIESVEKGWGGPFGAVIVRDGEIIGRGQNRVLLTGVPIHHAEITAIMDACTRLNGQAGPGTQPSAATLAPAPRHEGSHDPLPARARMLMGCEIYINAPPCPMCLSAIYWARIEQIIFGASLEDTTQIGFDDEFQYSDLRRTWEERRIARCFPNFEREVALEAFAAWTAKPDRIPY